jgi:hypothetical protein
MEKLDALSQCPDHRDGTGDNSNVILLKPELFTIRALEGVKVEGEERDILWEIWYWNRNGEQEDAVAIAAKAPKEARVGSLQSTEWRETQGVL